MTGQAVFLDRDGTINREVSYLDDVAMLQLIDGGAEGIRQLNRAGFKVVVVTNQSAVARGYLSEETLHSIHRALEERLQVHEATLDAIYYCPHHPTDGAAPYRRRCGCRKPNPGMIQRAADELDVELNESYVVGDKIIDMQAGQRAGCKTVLVRTGYGSEAEKKLEGQAWEPDLVASDLLEASTWILAQQRQLQHL